MQKDDKQRMQMQLNEKIKARKNRVKAVDINQGHEDHPDYTQAGKSVTMIGSLHSSRYGSTNKRESEMVKVYPSGSASNGISAGDSMHTTDPSVGDRSWVSNQALGGDSHTTINTLGTSAVKM